MTNFSPSLSRSARHSGALAKAMLMILAAGMTTACGGGAMSSPAQASSVIAASGGQVANGPVSTGTPSTAGSGGSVTPASGTGSATSASSGGSGAVSGSSSTGSGTSVGTSSATQSGPLGISGAGLNTISNIQTRNNWSTCGACGNSAGNNSVPVVSYSTGVVLPSEDSQATQFTISNTSPYTNGYWWVNQPPVAQQLNSLHYALDVYIPMGTENLPQAIEFECQQQIGGYIYNFAWQADYAHGQWRTFNYPTQNWDASAVPFARLTPGTWHHIEAEYHNDLAAHTVTHDALTIDGVRYAVGMVHAAKFTGSGTTAFTNALQLDTNGNGSGFSVYVDGMTVGWN